MFKRTQLFLLLAIPALAVLLLNLPPSVAARFKRSVGAVFLPLFGASRGMASIMDQASFATLPRSALLAELHQLRAENELLKIQSYQAASLAAEVSALQIASQRIALATPPGWNPRPARIVAREPTTWWRTATLDYGTRDGAAVDQPVITTNGLVGRISAAGYSHSQVALVGDASCGVSAVVLETGNNGIIAGGQSTLNLGRVEWTALAPSPQVLAGHTLMTSGLGGVFPKGIPIGRILDTRTEQAAIATSARVNLFANLNHLEVVFVLQLPPTVADDPNPTRPSAPTATTPRTAFPPTPAPSSPPRSPEHRTIRRQP